MREFWLRHPLLICGVAFFLVMLGLKYLGQWAIATIGLWIVIPAVIACFGIGLWFDRRDRARGRSTRI